MPVFFSPPSLYVCLLPAVPEGHLESTIRGPLVNKPCLSLNKSNARTPGGEYTHKGLLKTREAYTS